MRHNDLLSTLQNLILRTPKQKEIAEAIEVKLSVIGNRASRNSNYSLEELVKLSTFFGVDLVSVSNFNVEAFSPVASTQVKEDIIEQITETTKEKSCVIPYYDDSDFDKEKITNPHFTELLLDLQKVISVYGANPDDLRFISMIGDEMDGGIFPIKNNDLLVINTSITDLSTTGIYFCKTNYGLFVRRITQLISDGAIYCTVDNPMYTEILSKKFTIDRLEEMGFKVLGKVIGNESIRL